MKLFFWTNYKNKPMLPFLVFLLLLIIFCFIDSIRCENDEKKQMRRNEVSKALLLLKKHSVVGNDAKIVLKNNGRHLLVDPSEKIRVVTNHLSKSRKNFKLSKIQKPNRRNNRKVNNNINNKALRSVPSMQPSIESIQRNLMRKAASKSANVIDSLMGAQMLKDITQLVSTIVRNEQANSLVELSDLITETLNERYGPHWHTISVASPKAFPHSDSSSNHELLIDTILANQNQLNSLTHVAVDDHQKSAIFYATFDFGRTLRIFIFK